MATTAPAYMLLVEEATLLDSEVTLYKVMAYEGTTMSNITLALKKFWRKFIEWLTKWLSNIGKFIVGVPKFFGSIWRGVRDLKTRVRSQRRTVLSVFHLGDKLAKKYHDLFSSVSNAYEEGQPDDPESFDRYYDEMKSEIEYLNNTASRINEATSEADIIELSEFAIESTLSDGENPTVNEVKVGTSKYVESLQDILHSTRKSQESVRREAENASKNVDRDDPEEQSNHQTFLSKICALFSLIASGIMSALRAFGRLIINVITGNGFTTADDTKVVGDERGVIMSTNKSDFTWDIGGAV